MEGRTDPAEDLSSFFHPDFQSEYDRRYENDYLRVCRAGEIYALRELQGLLGCYVRVEVLTYGSRQAGVGPVTRQAGGNTWGGIAVGAYERQVSPNFVARQLDVKVIQPGPRFRQILHFTLNRRDQLTRVWAKKTMRGKAPVLTHPPATPPQRQQRVLDLDWEDVPEPQISQPEPQTQEPDRRDSPEPEADESNRPAKRQRVCTVVSDEEYWSAESDSG